FSGESATLKNGVRKTPSLLFVLSALARECVRSGQWRRAFWSDFVRSEATDVLCSACRRILKNDRGRGMLVSLIERHGLALVFANVLLEEVGLPIPAVPTLIVCGALAAEGRISAAAVLGLAFLASLIGDSLRFIAGRFSGRRVLRFLCGISFSPDSCVRQTQTQFERWGGIAVVAGKFIPGLSTLAPPLAGAMRYGWARFTLLNSLGILVWAGLAIGAGMLFQAQVSAVLAWLEDLGRAAVALVLAVLCAYVAFKWWERQRLYKTLRVARITVQELRKLMDKTPKPV